MAEVPEVKTYPIAARLQGQGQGSHPRPKPHIDEPSYKSNHAASLSDPTEFWGKLARETISWDVPFRTVQAGSLAQGNVTWFPEGQLNAAYNCVDRWAFKNPDKVALIWEADEPNSHKEITFGELLKQVSQAANVLKKLGVKKGDAVVIYLPMIPEAVVSLLACARIGAVHSVVFAGFSAESLRDRANDCEARVLITTDEGKRGGRTIATKSIADAAVKQCPKIEHVLVVQRTGAKVDFDDKRDIWWHEAAAAERTYCPPTIVSSEDPLFILYTSGSTGKPKGVVHTTAGYLLGTALTVKHVFDVHEDDKFACMADVGWITGHSYIVYGPLMNGVTTLVFESTPVYPEPNRYWEIVEKHKLTQFYTAPTSIRLLRRLGEEHVKKHDLTSLRVIGSVGEPINPEAWEWYNTHVGGGECAVVDTYWQTETGSILITPLPGATKTKPGSATLPFWGVEPVILDPQSGKELEGNDVEGVLAIKRPWPSMARTIFNDHTRFLDVYLNAYKGYYFTGDGAARDKDGYIWIKGRVDDVVNVSGHRLSTAEIESALITHPGVAETAAIGIADEVTGQTVVAYVTLKPDFEMESEEALTKELVVTVRRTIGPFAAPKKIILSPDLPKTRSGKIMRRILRKIASGEADQLGDTSSLADPSIVDKLVEQYERTKAK
ncbi:acetyl-coenzyme A synthetase 2 [Tilletia horrida]|uniref:Acetyl-coenzyme A synthetase n=1 Tax=Tilletia horrida TaxID=155126 RepID=A0AAN6JGW0_9BASI|nr:acetyl-coenzyme A synthetase 2 [Tilletia horrida]